MIGIVTINEDRNYGAVLQATSLQQFLYELGIDNRFVTIEKNLDEVLNISFNSLKSIVKSTFTRIHFRELKDGCDKFREFVENNQNSFERYRSYEELQKNPPKVDGYIVGSDQVWPETNLLPFYGLAFDHGITKISYAASMGGNNISECKKETYKSFFKDFNAISIREKTAIKAISEVFDGEVQYHIDPTLLHDTAFWNTYEEPYQRKLPEKYILVYMIYTPKDINKKLNKLKRETGLPIILVSNTPYKKIKCDRYIRDAGPAEFLWLIKHAEGVVSSSYHGVIFSILYKKPLLAINNPSKPTRIIDLLELLQLEPMLEWDESFLSKEYNRELVDSIIQEERERSKQYLQRYFAIC